MPRCSDVRFLLRNYQRSSMQLRKVIILLANLNFPVLVQSFLLKPIGDWTTVTFGVSHTTVLLNIRGRT